MSKPTATSNRYAGKLTITHSDSDSTHSDEKSHSDAKSTTIPTKLQPKNPTRRGYKQFHGTNQQEQQMLIIALRSILQKDPDEQHRKFQQTKNLRKNIQNYSRTIQNEDTPIPKLREIALKTIASTHIKKRVDNKMEYSQHFINTYSNLKKSPANSPKISTPTEIDGPNLLDSPNLLDDAPPHDSTMPTITPNTTMKTTIPTTPNNSPTKQITPIHRNTQDNQYHDEQESISDLGSVSRTDSTQPFEFINNNQSDDKHNNNHSESFLSTIEAEGYKFDKIIMEEWKQSMTDTIQNQLDAELTALRKQQDQMHHNMKANMELQWTLYKANKDDEFASLKYKERTIKAKHLLEHMSKERQHMEKIMAEYEQTKAQYRNDITTMQQDRDMLHKALDQIRTEIRNEKAQLAQLQTEQENHTQRTQQMIQESKDTLSTIGNEVQEHFKTLHSKMNTYQQNIQETTQKSLDQHRTELTNMRKTQRNQYHHTLLTNEKNILTAHAKTKTQDIVQEIKNTYHKYVSRLNTKATEAEGKLQDMYDQVHLDLDDTAKETTKSYTNMLNNLANQHNTQIKEHLQQTYESSIDTFTQQTLTMDIQQQIEDQTKQTISDHLLQLQTMQDKLQTTISDAHNAINKHKEKLKTEITHEITKLTDNTKMDIDDTAAIAKATVTNSLQDSKHKITTDIEQEWNTKILNHVHDFDHQLQKKIVVRELEAKRKEKEWFTTINQHIRETTAQLNNIQQQMDNPTSTQTTIPSHFRGKHIDLTTPIPKNLYMHPKSTHTTQSTNSTDLDSKIYRFKKDEIYVNHIEPIPTGPQMESYYQTIVASMTAYDLPIFPLTQLQPRGNTLPTDHGYPQDTIDRISQTLYQKLLKITPTQCTDLHNIMNNYSGTQDGYKALYAMMRATCNYLHDIRPKWGPKWEHQQNAHQYLSALNSYLAQATRNGIQYTQFKIAAEIIQQAKRHPKI